MPNTGLTVTTMTVMVAVLTMLSATLSTPARGFVPVTDAGTYSPLTDTMFLPSQNTCATITALEPDQRLSGR